MSTQTTTWELRLKDYISSPFKKLVDYAGGAQKKINDVNGGLDKAAKAANVTGREFKRSFSQLDSLLQNLKKRQSEAFSTRHIQHYQKMIDKTSREMEKLNRISMGSKWGQFKTHLGNSMGMIPGMSGVMPLLTNPYTAVIGGALAVGKALHTAYEMSKKWQEGMAAINATAQLTKDGLSQLSNELLEMGKNSATAIERIPEAYEKLVSSLGHSKNTMDILKQSLLASDATGTDVSVITDAMAKIMGNVGNTRSASQILNSLIGAKREGAGEFQDFATYLPELISSSQLFNMSPESVMGMFSYMTGKSSASTSAMLIQNMFSALSKGDVREKMKTHGIELFDKKGELKNFDEIIIQMSKKFNSVGTEGKLGLVEAMGLKDQQAKMGFSKMMADTDKLTTALDSANNAMSYTSDNFKGVVGELNVALAIAERDNPMIKINRATNYFKSLMIEIGNKIMPVVQRVFGWIVEKIQHGVEKLIDFYNESELLQDVVWVIGKVFEGIGWVIGKIVDGLSWIWNKIIEPIWSKLNQIYQIFKALFTGNLDKAIQLNMEMVMGKKPEKKSGEDKTTAESALDNINKGLPAGGEVAVGESGAASGKLSGDGSKVRTLIMNLNMTNVFKADTDSSLQSIKEKIKNTIVDAARDGMVTVGV